MSANESEKRVKRGRPTLTGEVVEIHVHLRLRRGEDDDLLEFFARAGPRHRVVYLKQALRTGNLNAPTIQDTSDEEELADALQQFMT